MRTFSLWSLDYHSNNARTQRRSFSRRFRYVVLFERAISRSKHTHDITQAATLLLYFPHCYAMETGAKLRSSPLPALPKAELLLCVLCARTAARLNTKAHTEMLGAQVYKHRLYSACLCVCVFDCICVIWECANATRDAANTQSAITEMGTAPNHIPLIHNASHNTHSYRNPLALLSAHAQLAQIHSRVVLRVQPRRALSEIGCKYCRCVCRVVVAVATNATRI